MLDTFLLNPAGSRSVEKIKLETLGSIVSLHKKVQPIGINEILRETALSFGVTVDQIVSANRQPEFVKPRHVAIYLSCQLVDLSLSQIGCFFGDRDHKTILHAVRKLEKQAKKYARGQRNANKVGLFIAAKTIKIKLGGGVSFKRRKSTGKKIQPCADQKVIRVKRMLDEKVSVPLPAVNIEVIKRLVAACYEITASAFNQAPHRKQNFDPHHVARYLACTVARLSSTRVARIFGLTDHSTILNSKKRVEKNADLLAVADEIAKHARTQSSGAGLVDSKKELYVQLFPDDSSNGVPAMSRLVPSLEPMAPGSTVQQPAPSALIS